VTAVETATIRAPRVLVVEHERAVPVGLLGERLAAAGCRVEQVGPDTGRPIPRVPDGTDGVVVLGGSMGPLDDDVAPWLPDVRALITACLAAGTPLLAICLGAELLAHVAGGHVAPVAAGPEIGLTPIRLLPTAVDDPVLAGVPPVAAAVQWHSLEARSLPPEAVVLAESDRCANQAFRLGDAAWGVQFHPEVLADIAAGWARTEQADLVALHLDGAAVVGAVRNAEPELRAAWTRLADNWIAVVRGAALSAVSGGSGRPSGSSARR
jgi:GMP synthase-like glutamine amidotransferase